ncbi:hypothetical protein [Kocuria sp. HSID16901]|uniref:hypothetical protein n=1 Tax=Kocuria sp. HSID16901 TaxID=2419505 RepID=UPI000F875DF3|nr:hypothetical protein [Kocuria sp. HSID16901]RUQ19833.1 hypothetical protein D8M21_10960 [Kocuria sp. HSID16901]
MWLGNYELPKNSEGLNEHRGTSTASQRRVIERLGRRLPEIVFGLYCLSVGGRPEELDQLSEWKAGLLIHSLQSGDPASVAVSRPMAGTVQSLLEFNGYRTTAPHEPESDSKD